MVVLPPCPAMLISDAFVAKLIVEGPPVLEKKSTCDASDLSDTISPIPLRNPNHISPSTLKFLVLILVYDKSSLVLANAPPISTLEILVPVLSGVTPKNMLLCSDERPMLMN